MGSTMLQTSDSVGSFMNGSITAVSGSGTTSMSLAWMGIHPRMDDPSKPSPSSNTASVNSASGTVKCCQRPMKSMNFRSTITARLSCAYPITSFAFGMWKSPEVDLAFPGRLSAKDGPARRIAAYSGERGRERLTKTSVISPRRTFWICNGPVAGGERSRQIGSSWTIFVRKIGVSYTSVRTRGATRVRPGDPPLTSLLGGWPIGFLLKCPTDTSLTTVLSLRPLSVPRAAAAPFPSGKRLRDAERARVACTLQTSRLHGPEDCTARLHALRFLRRRLRARDRTSAARRGARFVRAPLPLSATAGALPALPMAVVRDGGADARPQAPGAVASRPGGDGRAATRAVPLAPGRAAARSRGGPGKVVETIFKPDDAPSVVEEE